MDNAAFELSENTFKYQASSPDEKALAEACQRLFRFKPFELESLNIQFYTFYLDLV